MNKPIINNGLTRILAFPKGKSKWRISWIGEVAFPNRTLRRMQPSALVHLTQIQTLFPTNRKLIEKNIWVSVGILPSLKIGDVYQDGYLIEQIKSELEKFEIDTKNITLIKAGLSLEDGGFLIPAKEHPFHMSSTQSYCV